MRRYTGALFYLIGGTLAGVASAYALIQHAGVEPLGSGTPWQSRIASLDGNAGIYVSSYYLLAGRLPLAAGQLVEASADADDSNETLSSQCVYEIVSTGQLSRWWSLAAAGSISTSAQETLDSGLAVSEPDGTVRITAAAAPQPGNWLKTPSARHFSLLYAAVKTGGRPASQVPPFSITRKGC